MGCFSFICKKSGEPVLSSSFDGDAVHLFLLKNGKVIEHMFGNYDSYGRVFNDKPTPEDSPSKTMYQSFEWQMDWFDVVELMCNKNPKDGIAAVLASVYDGVPPTTCSEDDPNQGWGEWDDELDDVKEYDDVLHDKDFIDKPFHKKYYYDRFGELIK